MSISVVTPSVPEAGKVSAAFQELLPLLGFKLSGSVWAKSVNGTELAVDMKARKILYPTTDGLIVHDETTSNFSQMENVVVFECVHRLLEKGYKPKSIELEPKWPLGRGEKSGKADILVRNRKSKPLLLIECKCHGREFDRAWERTLRDGDQLFSYAQQVSAVQFLCLYTSRVTDGTLDYASNVIAHRDNDAYLESKAHLTGFRDVDDARSRHDVWRDTYKLGYEPIGIFEPSLRAYEIGKNKTTLEDLKPISTEEEKKQYHRFATILRQHNVSGRENAFDKLINLLLCKLVDEIENPKDLKFYWRGVANDDHFDLLDRLQQLYQSGMARFLGEDITYINERDVATALRFNVAKPDATQKAVWNLFVRQKFFTNNDFSFIDVHNEKLFYQNAEVLLEVIDMWQKFRLTERGRAGQLLGDMFEGFLDQGVKQSEGQFFTPMPVCSFMVGSLPLKNLPSWPAVPKSVDYACGAGHFLNELAAYLEPLAAEHGHSVEVMQDSIYGIEKEYRLSKVAKVSAFMHGNREINICYGDALVQEHPSHPAITNGSFDVIVANPPFSVRGFLSTLPSEERRKYSLSSTVGEIEAAAAIELFFLERAAQLLKSGGVGSIIFPDSILSNGTGIYVRARKVLLEKFDLVAIVELGSGAFGKTGTSTSVLFLRRKANPPEAVEHWSGRILEWFDKPQDPKKKKAYKDGHLLGSYMEHIGVDPDDYASLMAGEPRSTLWHHPTFSAYRIQVEASSDFKNLKKQRRHKLSSPEQQEKSLTTMLTKHAVHKEREKLLHFLLAKQQGVPVLIVKSPNETKVRKAYLGYDWSGTKGSEGIQLVRDAAGNHKTPLYDPTDLANPDKVNSLVSANFRNVQLPAPPELTGLLGYRRLEDMLDFGSTALDWQISTVIDSRSSPTSSTRWPEQRLDTVAKIQRGASPRPIENFYTDAPDGVNWIKIGDVAAGAKYVEKTAQRITQRGALSSRRVVPGDFILSNSMSAGRPYIVNIEGCVHDGWLTLSEIDEKVIRKEYLYYILSDARTQQQFRERARGPVVKNLNIGRVQAVSIPVPDLLTQEAIIAACSPLDEEVVKAQTTLATVGQRIRELFRTELSGSAERTVGEVCVFEYGKPLPEVERTGGEVPVMGSNGIVGWHSTALVTGPCIVVGRKGSAGQVTWQEKDCYPIDTTFYVRQLTDDVDPKFLYFALGSLELRGRGSGVPGLNRNDAMKHTIPVPDRPLQEALLLKIEVLEREAEQARILADDITAKREAIIASYL